MRSAALILERFDAHAFPQIAAGDGVTEQFQSAEAYEAGFAAGKAAAESAARDLGPALAGAAQALQAELAEAPGRITSEAANALRIVLEAIFPALSQAGFAIEAAEAFARAARQTDADALEISVAPAHAEALAAELRKRAPECNFVVKEDPSLSGAAARASWPSGGVDFDLDKAVHECLSALARARENIRSEKNP